MRFEDLVDKFYINLHDTIEEYVKISIDDWEPDQSHITHINFSYVDEEYDLEESKIVLNIDCVLSVGKDYMLSKEEAHFKVKADKLDYQLIAEEISKLVTEYIWNERITFRNPKEDYKTQKENQL